MDVISLTLAGSQMICGCATWLHRTYTCTPPPSPAERHRTNLLTLLYWINMTLKQLDIPTHANISIGSGIDMCLKQDLITFCQWAGKVCLTLR